MSSSSPPAWDLQAKLWQRDLSPSSPFMNHHDYEKEQFKPKLKENNNSSPLTSSDHQLVNNNNNTPSRALVTSNNNNNTQEGDEAQQQPQENEDQQHTSHLDISHEIPPTTIYSGRSQYNHDVEEGSAMQIEAAAVVDEFSPDRGSLRCVRRRAEALRSEKQAQQDPNADPNQSVFTTKTTDTNKHSHGLEAVKNPYRLHSIVSQKDLNKRKRVDEHATSSSMLGQRRISNKMSDVDLAAYHPHQKYSFKQDKEPDVLLAETVIAARGGLTPEERINKQVNKFVEQLMNAAERESENAMLPPPNKARFTVPFASPIATPRSNITSTTPTSNNKKHNSSSISSPSPSILSSSSIKRKGGLAKKLIEEQEHHMVDALASIMLTKANPPTIDELQGIHEGSTPTRNNAFSFALTPDDKHILLTALKFSLSEELYPTEADFSRVIGFSRSDGHKVLKALATTFDHWNKLCYDHGGEWTLLKRCLAAVAETPINWSVRPHTTRSVHFGTVTQRDLEGLLARFRNDEVRKVPRSKIVVERHRNRMV